MEVCTLFLYTSSLAIFFSISVTVLMLLNPYSKSDVRLTDGAVWLLQIKLLDKSRISQSMVSW